MTRSTPGSTSARPRSCAASPPSRPPSRRRSSHTLPRRTSSTRSSSKATGWTSGSQRTSWCLPLEALPLTSAFPHKHTTNPTPRAVAARLLQYSPCRIAQCICIAAVSQPGGSEGACLQLAPAAHLPAQHAITITQVCLSVTVTAALCQPSQGTTR